MKSSQTYGSVYDDQRRQGRDYTRLAFTVTSTTLIGQQVFILGDAHALGSFSLQDAVPLETSPSEYPLWRTSHDILVPKDVPLVFKCALYSGGEFQEWESIDGQRVITPRGRRQHVEVIFGQAGGVAAESDDETTHKPNIDDGDISTIDKTLMSSSPLNNVEQTERGMSSSQTPTSATETNSTTLESQKKRRGSSRKRPNSNKSGHQQIQVQQTTLFGGDHSVQKLIDATTLLEDEQRDVENVGHDSGMLGPGMHDVGTYDTVSVERDSKTGDGLNCTANEPQVRYFIMNFDFFFRRKFLYLTKN